MANAYSIICFSIRKFNPLRSSLSLSFELLIWFIELSNFSTQNMIYILSCEYKIDWNGLEMNWRSLNFRTKWMLQLETIKQLVISLSIPLWKFTKPKWEKSFHHGWRKIFNFNKKKRSMILFSISLWIFDRFVSNH